MVFKKTNKYSQGAPTEASKRRARKTTGSAGRKAYAQAQAARQEAARAKNAASAAKFKAEQIKKKAISDNLIKINMARLRREQQLANQLRNKMNIARLNKDFSTQSSAAVELRENMKRQAEIRGKSFSPTETRKFLGGSAGVQALRAGTTAERQYFKRTGISLSQAREKLRQQAEIMKGVTVSRILAETLPSQRAGYVRIRLPNGKIEEIRSSGRVNFNKAYAGEKVVVNNGQVVQVGESATERVRVGTFSVYTRGDILKAKLKRLVKPIGDDAAAKRRLEEQAQRVMDKQAVFQSTLTTKQIMAMPSGSARRKAQLARDKAELSWAAAAVGFGLLAFATGVTIGAKKIPAGATYLVKNSSKVTKLPGLAITGVKKLVNNPGVILKVEGAVRNAIKEYIAEVGAIAKISPTVAIAKVGTDWYLLKLTNKGFNVAGRFSVGAVKKLKTFVKVARKASVAKAGTKAVTSKVIAREYSQSLKAARKARSRVRQKYTTIRPNSPDFQRAIVVTEAYAERMAEVKAKQYIISYINKGSQLTRSQADDFIRGVKNMVNDKLKNAPSFQRLQTLDKIARNNAIKLIKTKKISPAKVYAKKLIDVVENTPFAKKMNEIMKKVKAGVKIRVGKVKAKAKSAKIRMDTTKSKIKSSQQYKKELSRAKARRKKMSNKYDVLKVGNSDYIEAMVFIDDYAKLVSVQRAKKIVSEYAKRGLKLTTAQKSKVIELSRKQAETFLRNSNTYKQLKIAARLSKPSSLRLYKVGKIKLARSYARNLQTSVRNIKGMRQLRDAIRGIKKSPTRIKKGVVRKKAVKAAQKKYKQTNRYIMDKNRPIRSVSVERLSKTNTVTNMNKFVDDLFNEMSRRRKLDVTSLQFRQSKNILKKRLRRAINAGSKDEIVKFRDWARKTMRDLDNPKKQPTVRVAEARGIKKTRTIKDFKPDSPKGTYKEVKVGNQIQLQKVKTAPSKQAQRVAQKTMQKQRLVIKSVSKQTLSLKPLTRVIASSIGIQIAKTVSASKFKSGQTQQFISKLGQDAKQDYKTIVGIDTAVKSAVTLAVLQAQKSKVKPRLITKTRQVTDKKVTAKISIPKGFTKKKVSKPTSAFYVVVKRRGKWVKLMARPLIKKDARDYLAYSIDNGLERSAFFVPMGKHKQVAKLPTKMVNYYGKTSQKLRPYKVRAGKRKQLLDGYIERSKYVGDTKREIKQLQTTRKKKTTKKRVVKRKPVKRKSSKKKKR